jgi:hypothetical protein
MSGLPFECETSAGAHALDPRGGGKATRIFAMFMPNPTKLPRHVRSICVRRRQL